MSIPALTHKHLLILKLVLRKGKNKTDFAYLSDNSLYGFALDGTWEKKKMVFNLQPPGQSKASCFLSCLLITAGKPGRFKSFYTTFCSLPGAWQTLGCSYLWQSQSRLPPQAKGKAARLCNILLCLEGHATEALSHWDNLCSLICRRRI